MWMVRSNGGDLVSDFIDRGLVAVGWQSAGDLGALASDRDAIIERVAETWPENRRMQNVVAGSQLNKIANVMKIGDRVITYDPSSRIYHVGEVVGPYRHQSSDEPGLANQRPVKWAASFERDRLSTPTKNSLGSSLSIFEVSESAENEIDALIANKSIIGDAEQSAIAETELNEHYLLDDLKARAKEFIKDRVAKLDWESMQELVAGLLRAMNYKTKISPRGADRGRDIIASPDGLGFENPRIVVEVKHRPGQTIGSNEVRSFLGGRHRDDRGLYVSTGGFTKDAKYEADRASIPLTLMDLDELVDMLLDFYDQLDLHTRTLVPLSRIYWPN